VHQLVNKKNL